MQNTERRTQKKNKISLSAEGHKGNLGSWTLDLGLLLTAFVLLFAAGCSGLQVSDGETVSSIPTEVREDLTVSGTIRVRGEVKVFSGATLTVKPGTRFLFEPFDPDGDGVNDSRLLIEGRLVARGDPDAPIFFTSAASDPEPGDWLELRMDRSEGSVLEYSVLEHSRYGLHVHFSSGIVANSVFRSNIDGTRFGTSRFELILNRFTKNLGKGINLRASQLWIVDNIIENNRHGVFLFEEGDGSVIAFNRFADNDISDLRFGDFYEGEPPELFGNYRPDGSSIRTLGYEGDIDPHVNKLEPAPTEFMPGPRIWNYHVEELWTRDLGSFIDASPVLTEDVGQRVIAATWGNGLHVLDKVNGATVSKINVPDVTDASPIFWSEYPPGPSGVPTPVSKVNSIIFPSWDLKIRKADVNSGEIVSELSWDPSLADDHRQAAPLIVYGSEHERLVALGLWNGQFGLLDPETMEWVWTVQLDGAVRARAAKDDRNIWVGTDNGSLYRVSMEGEVLNQVDLGAHVRTTPLVIEGDSVIVVTSVGVLMRVTDGEIVWRRRLPGPGTYASPLWLYGAHFVVGDGSGNLSAFSENGALMWVTEFGSAIHVVAGNEFFSGAVVGTEDGSLHGVNYIGRPVFAVQTGGAVHSAVVDAEYENVLASKTTVIWGSRDGRIRAARINQEVTPWEIPE